jgi:3-oxoadipate enol-lactonase / 4-carboxymuconolactone decarboxylase
MAVCDVHHRVDGPEGAPALVLANSLGSTLEIWDPIVPVLAQRFRVVRFDLRGHGRSPVPPPPYSLADLGEDALALLDRLELDRAAFCGISIGGMVGMWLGAHAPARIDGLVLCCTAARLGPPERWAERAATVRAEGAGAVAEAVVANWFTPGFAAREPEVVARMEAMIAAQPPEGYAACCEVIERMDLREDLPSITASTLVVAGGDDDATPPEHGLGIAQGVPGARLVVLPHAAHLAPVEQPAAVAALVLEHLGGDPVHAAGMAERRRVLGDAHVDRALARTTPFTAPFQDFITRYAWGSVWTRPGLDRSVRSAITLAALTALGRDEELAMHVRGALRNGLSAEEIGEVLLHTGVYAGVPAANRAFQIAQEALAEEEARRAASGDGGAGATAG